MWRMEEAEGYNDRPKRNRRPKGEDDYVVFPSSIFFWMARAEW